MMKLYQTDQHPWLQFDGRWFPLHDSWDALVNHDDLPAHLARLAETRRPAECGPAPESIRAPIGSQEVWAAGVTYLRSKVARMEESQAAGGSDFYDRVYAADRPELFFKATPHRVGGPGAPLRLRSDSRWIVPEPELTLVINRRGRIIGHTIGNDLSCRDIEGENPLYLPQAKVFSRCAGLGPCVLVGSDPLPPDTAIGLSIRRADAEIFAGRTTLDRLKRTGPELAAWLFRDNDLPHGALLMTGTGVVPPDGFCLLQGDVVHITIDPIGTLTNPMTAGPGA
jgi:2-dehydro-3-deoxy-D-arabinonate dehydratase